MKVVLKTAILLFLLLGSAILGIIGWKSVKAESVIYVPNDFPTIQAAIDGANEGDSILVSPGIYTERLSITKSISVIGSGPSSTIIESPGGGDTVKISRVASVVFAGFTVKGTDAWRGIRIEYNLGNVTIENNVVEHHEVGIEFYDSSGGTLRDNDLRNNRYNLRVWGLGLSHFLHDIDNSNLVAGKPVYYWVNKHNGTVPFDAGYVALVNSSNIIVKNINLSNNGAGVLLAYTNNSTISGVTAVSNERGLYLVSSHKNSLVGNSLLNNSWSGILTVSSRGNSIVRNSIKGNGYLGGIRLSHAEGAIPGLGYSDNNLIHENIADSNFDGIYLESSNNNNVSDNIVVNNERYGIAVDDSSHNVFLKNVIMNNRYAVWIYSSGENAFFHNSFVNNTNSVSIDATVPSNNTWSMAYPVGGNFWGSAIGEDAFSGPYQDQPGSDGIIDTPHIIDGSNVDRYPLSESGAAARGAIMKYQTVLYLSIPSEATVGTPINLSATLWDYENQVPLADSIVHFYIEDNETNNEIGFSTTNELGVATISYLPSEAGNFRIIAVFEGSLLYNVTKAVQDIKVSESFSFQLESWIIAFVLAAFALSFFRLWIRRKRKGYE